MGNRSPRGKVQSSIHFCWDPYYYASPALVLRYLLDSPHWVSEAQATGAPGLRGQGLRGSQEKGLGAQDWSREYARATLRGQGPFLRGAGAPGNGQNKQQHSHHRNP